MSDTPQGIRRIVTEVRDNGKSAIVEDGPAPAMVTVPERPGYVVSNIWVTTPTPAPIDQPDDSLGHRGILPPKNGTILRVIEYPPEPDTKEEFEADLRPLKDVCRWTHGYWDFGPGVQRNSYLAVRGPHGEGAGTG